MIKYIFNIIACILTLTVWIYVYSIKNKRTAMFKVIYVGISSLYFAVQMFLYFRICKYMPEAMEPLSYKIQGWCLGGFLIAIFIYTLANAYIRRIQKKEDESIGNFRQIRKELEECSIIVKNDEVRKQIMNLSETARYMDPVCYGVEQEEQQILQLLQELKRSESQEAGQNICLKIDELFKLRKIRADKK